MLQFCPYGQPGDVLWVRETWLHIDDEGDKFDGMGSQTYWRADQLKHPDGGKKDQAYIERKGLRWRQSIFMPRWASRIDLRIESVRVERLQEISEEDAQSEGCPLECMTPTGDDDGSAIYGPSGFMALWQSIHGPESWDANPWVWVLTFARIKP
jgi:hypothetical protein